MSAELVRKQIIPLVGDGETTHFEVKHELGRFAVVMVFDENYHQKGIIPTWIFEDRFILDFGQPIPKDEVFNVLVMG
jgi:hypothetical protein